MIIDIVKVFFPSVIAFVVGTGMTPILTDYLYRNEMWKKKSVQGVLLAEQVHPLWILSIPVVSALVGLFTVVMIYRELRRKAYERA